MRHARILLVLCIYILTMMGSALSLAQTEAQEETPAAAATATPSPAPTPAKEKVAWHSHNYFGVGGQVSYPRSSYGHSYDTGFGLQGIFDYPLIPLIDLCGSVGWNRFPHVDDGSILDIWEMAFGMRFVLGTFFMNGEMGYYSKIDEASFIPGLGMRYDHWEFSMRTKATGSSTWSTLRVGYYF